MKIIYLLLSSLVLIMFVVAFLFVDTVLEVYTLGNKVEKSLVAAGWAGFSQVDLDLLAKRRDISNEEGRDVYLFKDKAEMEVMNYIRKNLKLDASLYAGEDSYITDRDFPVIVDELEVYNPDDLPATCSRGVTFNRTTIHIVVRIPAKLRFVGFHYFEKHVDVDTKSFFKD